MAAILIKKYSNRRLYDTSLSSYVTLDELAEKIRKGADVRVIDAKTKEDLTQTILAQIILESRGTSKLLPNHLLLQLIRMEDDALSEFFSQYMAWALNIYQRMRKGAGTLGSFNPMGNPLAQLFTGFYGWQGNQAAGQGAQAQNPFAGLEPPPLTPMTRQQPPAVVLTEDPDDDELEDDLEPEELEPPPAPAKKAAKASAEPQASGNNEEVATMRKELDELKELLKMVAMNQQKGS